MGDAKEEVVVVAKKIQKVSDPHSYLWVVRDRDWGQIMGVYDWGRSGDVAAPSGPWYI
jgi:hypothetical protein